MEQQQPGRETRVDSYYLLIHPSRNDCMCRIVGVSSSSDNGHSLIDYLFTTESFLLTSRDMYQAQLSIEYV